MAMSAGSTMRGGNTLCLLLWLQSYWRGLCGRLGGGGWVDGPPENTERALQAVGSHLLNKVARTAAGTMGWIFPTALMANVDSALCDAKPVCHVQRHLEEAEQHIPALEQELHGFEFEFDNRVVSDSDDEHHETKDNDDEYIETVGPHLSATPVVRQKWGMSSLWPGGDILKGPPIWLSSRHIDHILRQSWLTWVRSFGKSKGKPWQLGFCDSETQGWARHLEGGLQVLTERSRRTTCEKIILKMWRPQRGPELAGVPSRLHRCKRGLMHAEVYCKGCVWWCRTVYKVCVLYCATALWFSCGFRTVFGTMWVDCIWNHVGGLWVMWVDCIWNHVGRLWIMWTLNATKIRSLKGWAWSPWGFFRVFNKNPAGVDLPLWRLSYNFTKTDGGLDLVMEDKGTPHAVALLAPWGQGLQHEFQVTPGIGFCHVLGM